MPDQQLWEQRAGESGPSYAAFLLYRDLGPRRTLDDAYRRTPTGGKGTAAGPKKAPGIWKLWSRQNDWVERADAWDQHLQRITDVEAEREAQRRAKEWGERRRRHKDEAYTVGQKLLKKAALMLDFPLSRREVLEEQSVGDKVVATKTVVRPGRWSFFTALQMAEAADRLIRLASDMPAQVEPAPAANFNDLFFETSGQAAGSLPEGALPTMPVDPATKPHIAALDDANKTPLTQPSPEVP